MATDRSFLSVYCRQAMPVEKPQWTHWPPSAHFSNRKTDQLTAGRTVDAVDRPKDRPQISHWKLRQPKTMTYDYICTACGHAWEAQQRISEDALKDCPSCKAATAQRQVSGGGGFILKGGGWYSDLYSSSKSSSTTEKSSTTTSATTSPCASGACGTSACPAASST
jgi:putative FmdB family regulatory protein